MVSVLQGHLSLSKYLVEKGCALGKELRMPQIPQIRLPEPVQPTDLCTVQGLPCAGNPWAPRKQLPTPFSVVKVLPVVWTCYEALLSNGMLGDSCRGGVGCAGLGSGRRDEASLMGEGGKRVAGGFGFCVSVFPTR